MADRKSLARKELARRELARRQQEQKPKTSRLVDVAGLLGSLAGPAGAALAVRGAEKLTGAKGTQGRPQEAALRNLLNTGLGGLPNLVTQGRFTPQPTTTAESIGGLAGKVGGALIPAGVAARGAGAVVRGAGLGAKVARGAITGGVTGAIIPPETSFNDLKARGKQALIGTLAGAGFGAAGGGIQKLKQLRSDKALAATERKLMSGFFKVKQDAVNKFVGQIDDLAAQNPTKRGVSIRELVDDVAREGDDAIFSPEAKRALRKIPKLKRLLDNPNLADDISVKDAQEIANAIKIPKVLTVNNFDLVDAKNTIKAAQLDAFPEMAAVRQQYKEVIQPFNLLKSQFKENRLIKAVERGFRGAADREALKKILPPQVIKQMGGIKRTADALKILGNLARSAARFAIGGAVAGGIIRGSRGGDFQE